MKSTVSSYLLLLVGFFLVHSTSLAAARNGNIRRPFDRALLDTNSADSWDDSAEIPVEPQSIYPFNSVHLWGNFILHLIKTTNTPPPKAAYYMAIMHSAIFDAVNGIMNTYVPYKSTPLYPATDANVDAAVASAAATVLKAYYPTNASRIQARFTTHLALIPDSIPKSLGLYLGLHIAEKTLASRLNDNSNLATQLPADRTINIGDWYDGDRRSPVLPYWSKVTPFAIESSSKYRPVNVPPLTRGVSMNNVTQQQYMVDRLDPKFIEEFRVSKDFGKRDSGVRNAEQTSTAFLWEDGANTFTPPGRWNLIARSITLRKGSSVLETARVYALMNIAMADAGIAAWDTKYAFMYWRPRECIRFRWRSPRATTTPIVASDPAWEPLLPTPPHPDFVSGHSTFSGAAAKVLSSIFGEMTTFTTTTNSLRFNGSLTYQNITMAAEMAGWSRVWGGIHFPLANSEGLKMGTSIGKEVMDKLLKKRS